MTQVYVVCSNCTKNESGPSILAEWRQWRQTNKKLHGNKQLAKSGETQAQAKDMDMEIK